MADLRHDFAQTVLKPGSEVSATEITNWYEQLEAQAMEQMSREGIRAEDVSLVRTADARYVGQGYELEVPAASGKLEQKDVEEIMERFHEAHIRNYGYASRDNPVEVVNLRVTALASMPRPDLAHDSQDAGGDPSRAIIGQRNVYFRNETKETSIYDRSLLRPGDVIEGPAIVEQLDSTTVVWENQTATVDNYLNLLVTGKHM